MSAVIALSAFLNIFILASPDLTVEWVNPRLEQLKVALQGREEIANQCLKSGLRIRYRFEMQVCRHRDWWTDSCGDERIFTRFLEHDAISDAYSITSDRLGDTDEPVTTHEASLAKARTDVSSLNPLSLKDLIGKDTKIREARRSYVRVRVLSECEGEYNRFLSKIPYFLTFGLVRFTGYNSGWTDFKLEPKVNGQ